MLQIVPVFEVLALLALANVSPIAAKRIMGDRLSRPLDGGIRLFDGQPLFGASKTIRGLVVALAMTALGAVLLGEPWTLGLAIGAASMAGDLASSFIKRRLGLPPSARATGLDQIPEALLPALAAMPLLGLTWPDVALTVVLFWLGGVVLSKWLFRLGFRDEPH
ncbi:CDP-archaeol synthase [Microbaculum marinisediminis]|uniref:CDP-archaeol synthase n=1 Tax=Microbaculum marinisediminis TaxID=2931392 RepID=A0AAW5R867_9HYPH|nr:CDP-archaeol synthase [Microbaculum sp. A6E488]MCT8974570.1 CDP-archaeol synthase [Microbaculum sp. A6E488]